MQNFESGSPFVISISHRKTETGDKITKYKYIFSYGSTISLHLSTSIVAHLLTEFRLFLFTQCFLSLLDLE